MKKPFLHTKLRQQLELSLNTDELTEVLRRMGAIVDSRNSDFMPFELNAADYRVEGVIERWQGTESRIRFEGEITIPPFNQSLRNRIVGVPGVLLALVAIFFITPWSMDFLAQSASLGFMPRTFSLPLSLLSQC